MAERFWTELARQQPLSSTWPLKLSVAANSRADYEQAENVLLDARARGAADRPGCRVPSPCGAVPGRYHAAC
jgi:hypothetical protein